MVKQVAGMLFWYLLTLLACACALSGAVLWALAGADGARRDAGIWMLTFGLGSAPALTYEYIAMANRRYDTVITALTRAEAGRHPVRTRAIALAVLAGWVLLYVHFFWGWLG